GTRTHATVLSARRLVDAIINPKLIGGQASWSAEPAHYRTRPWLERQEAPLPRPRGRGVGVRGWKPRSPKTPHPQPLPPEYRGEGKTAQENRGDPPHARIFARDLLQKESECPESHLTWKAASPS